jgi:uroporphyrinogen decarboxylase
VTWYHEFGYEGTFEIVGAYPEHARKMVEVGGARGYNNCRLVARAVREGLYPHAMLFGEDICSQRGPVVSPRFLERYYAPQLARNIALLLEAGCRPVWHSDGDVRSLVDMLIACGVQGFQGFQPECGMTLEYITAKRTREGRPLLIFGPLAVTTELPFLTADEIYERARAAIEYCRGRASLVMFTGNTINPDIPLDNIRAMYRAVREH